MTIPVLTLTEAADYARVSLDVIRAAYRARDLRVCYPTGSRRLIVVRQRDLDEWIEAWPTEEPVAS